MGFIKTILVFLFIVAFIYLGIGLIIAFGTSYMPDMSNAKIVMEAPVHLWNLIKNYVTSL